ncbi:MAG: DUF1800 domain-containing protein [Bryobacterales bacterium]|nr:DUF1800 domain-containing protein [Bryobacterales bacterium]
MFRRIHSPVFAVLAVANAYAQSPQVTVGAAARFLEQASFGPTSESVAKVQQLGFTKWIDEQFDVPPSTISEAPPAANGRAPLAPMQQEFYYNAVNGADQLRQRVAFALSQIWVVSGVKLTTANQMVPYLRILQQDAFTNYRQIMTDVTLSPAMGRYLDMVNNLKPDPRTGRAADENYARELLQLFTIGLVELNQDGTVREDAAGNPIPTYDQEQIEGFARAFTGWTYAPKPGAASRNTNPAYWDAPMVPVDANHDKAAKPLLNGVTLPAGQNVQRDLSEALDNVFAHENVAPFVSRQLIQRLVASDPSPAYVERVNRIFRQTGGDMKAVVKAILLDMEARAGDDGGTSFANEGKLREPVLYITGVLRALGARVDRTNGLPGQGSNLGQNVYLPPTVFNYFAPGYEIAGTGVNAPEFQVLTGSTAMLRADFMNTLLYRAINGVAVDWTPWLGGATSVSVLMDKVNNTFMRGAMTDEMWTSIARAVQAQSTARAKAQAAIYLAASSWQYQVQR